MGIIYGMIIVIVTQLQLVIAIVFPLYSINLFPLYSDDIPAKIWQITMIFPIGYT